MLCRAAVLLLVASLACAHGAVEHRRPRLPVVTPIDLGTYKTGVSAVPALGSDLAPCPTGFVASTDRVYLAMGSSLLESWFLKFAMPDLVAKRDPYACPRGVKRERTVLPSVCVEEFPFKGEVATLIVQGVVTYRCAGHRSYGRYSQALKVGIFEAHGHYVSPVTVPAPPVCRPPLLCGGLGGPRVPAVTALASSDNRQLGRSTGTLNVQTIPVIRCPAGYQRRSNWGTVDQEDTMARSLIDDYFLKITLPVLRRQGNPYGCPHGAIYGDLTPFFGKARPADANSKHSGTSSCYQIRPPGRGQTAIMYAQGIINYYCLDAAGKKTNPERFMQIYTAAGKFTQP